MKYEETQAGEVGGIVWHISVDGIAACDRGLRMRNIIPARLVNGTKRCYRSGCYQRWWSVRAAQAEKAAK